MDLQMVHRMDDMPDGSCSRVWQWEQLINIIVAYGSKMMRQMDLIKNVEARMARQWRRWEWRRQRREEEKLTKRSSRVDIYWLSLSYILINSNTHALDLVQNPSCPT